MKQVDNKYKCIPFWSWNDELDEKELCNQIDWMKSHGVGGFFMHARGGLKTEYLSEKWFSCINACKQKAKKLKMDAYAYDENGWPSGFVGGKLLENIEFHDMYIEHKIGEYDKKADYTYNLSNDKLSLCNGGDNCLNLYIKYSASTVDILNPKVVDEFLRLTHEEYKKRDDEKLLKGFFTDEPQYYRWGAPFSKMLVSYFRDKYNENIFDNLGLLFAEKDGYNLFRYKYWSAMQDLMLNNFAKKVYYWCDDNGYVLTGHYIEETFIQFQMMCCAGIMPFYEYEHIPGIDHLGREISKELAPKQVGSVSAQLDKKQTITETFAMCGWDVTPNELKVIAESQYVYGVNLMCQHLLPYSEYGQRKRDYPAHFSKINPWVDYGFKDFNDYFSVLGNILSNSKEIVSVAVLHNIKSAYCYYDCNNEKKEVVDLDLNIKSLIHELSSKQIPYHLLDENILAKFGKVKDSSLIVGKCKYDYIVLPLTYNIEKSTYEILSQFVKNGGKIIATSGLPSLVAGKIYNCSNLQSNCSYSELDVLSLSSFNENIRTTLRIAEDGKKFIYCVNVGNRDEMLSFNIDGYSSFIEYDIFNDRFRAIGKNVLLKKAESKILYLSNQSVCDDESKKILTLDGLFSVVCPVDNYLTLDFVSYSNDGINFSKKYHHMGLFNKLLCERYRGNLWLKYEFNITTIPQSCCLHFEKNRVDSVFVNNCLVNSFSQSNIDSGISKCNIQCHLQKGENTVLLKVDYFQDEKVYYALFGENVTESLKNCLTYNTNIEPTYLVGNFGVEGNFFAGNSDNIILGEKFTLTSQKKQISSFIYDGFPFFSGKIILEQHVLLDDTNYKLVINSRFHIIEVYVNGKPAGKLMFTNELDISKLLTKGDNVLQFVVIVGLRNTFGPFHTLEEENIRVTPNTFERKGQWFDGICDNFRNSYSFVKNLI